MDEQVRLLADHISLKREGYNGISDVNFTLKPGEILAVSGENGSGKTTLLKLLAGLLIPDQGEVFICGRSMTRQNRQAKRLIGYAPENFGVYDSMKGREYLEYYAAAMGITGLNARNRIDKLVDYFSLEKYESLFLDKMSAGTKQSFSLARCLLHDPAVLLFDEPQNYLDPQGRMIFRELCRSFSREGRAVVICSHNLSQLEGICTSIGFMKQGKLQRKEALKSLMDRLCQKSPLRITLADKSETEKTALLLRPLPFVKSISIDENNIMVGFAEGFLDERRVLDKLLENEIATVYFGREKMSLEDMFIHLNQEEG